MEHEPCLVLVVEDDVEVRDFAVAVLRDGGFLVAATGDAESALGFMRHVAVDVLFTDIVLPGAMNGLALARAARQLNPRLRVVCTTGFARAAEDDAGWGLCERFLGKPYRPDQLRIGIESVAVA
jgi:two-component system, response regulator PdtaR